MFHAGQKIGVYTLIKRLGRGGFGEVWLAERHGKFATTQVAVKLPLDEQVDHALIEQEAQLWAKANGHPNVLPIIEANEYDGQTVIVSEYSPDGSLEQFLEKNGGKLELEQTIEITTGILKGLSFLHSRQIIHRDLKPANILLQGEMPRLADFGISRVLKTSLHATTVAGTPYYMSPEAFKRERTVQTDIWSVGVILYQMLKGELPFRGNDIPEIFVAIKEEQPESLPNDVPLALEKIVMKSLAKKPAERFQTADEMRKELNNFWIEHSRPYTPLPTQPSIPPDDRVRPVIPPAPTRQPNMNPLYYAVPAVVLLLAAIIVAYKLINSGIKTIDTNPDTATTVEKIAGEISTFNLLHDVEMRFAFIPAGSFEMGSIRGDDDENPIHTVKISKAFWIAQTEVTQKQWKSVISELPQCSKGEFTKDFIGDDKPVVCVSWNEAKNFISKLNALDGSYTFRLPTEAEWEYAARSGTTTDYAGSLNAMTWYEDNSGGYPHNVATKQANAWNLYDMHGNVYEWCQDFFADYKDGTVIDPDNETRGSNRVIRGGSWDMKSIVARSANRFHATSSTNESKIGFRLVREIH